MLERRRPVRRGGRGQRQLPQRRGPLADVRPLAEATAEAVAAAALRAAPLGQAQPQRRDLGEIAGAGLGAGAEALTLVNTLLGMAVDLGTRRPALGGGGGGLSGAAVHPVAVRAVGECRAAFPDAPIVGVGGVRSGRDAVELLMAGADAVQVGTATFARPRAPWKIVATLERWCGRHQVASVRELIGAAHG